MSGLSRRGLTRTALQGRLRTRRLTHGEGMLSEAEQLAGFGSFHLDLATNEVTYSQGFGRIVGVADRAGPNGDVLLERVHPQDRELVRAAIDRFRSERSPVNVEVRIRKADGATRTVRIRGRCASGPGQHQLRLVGTVQDVTEEVEARAARQLLTNLVASSEDAIITKDRDGTVTSWNRGAESLYGYRAEEAVGSSISIIEPPELSGQQAEIGRKVFAGEPVERLETERVRKDGSRVHVSLTVSPVRDENDRIVLASVIARDVTEHKRYEQRLQYMADHDQLTGLLNRRRLGEELKRELARAGRHHLPGAVLRLDLDNFKAINDSFGHSAGDVVLVEVANTLRRRFRASDVLARDGGDEFTVLMTDVTAAHARAAAQDVLDAIAACRPIYGGTALRIAASIGVAAFESDDATSHEVLAHADLAMYAAKSAGRGRVVLYTAREGQRARAMMRQSWSDRIQAALKEDRFTLYLQPILDLSSGELSHGELLLRMAGKRGEVFAPAAFLPAAERDGFIHEIDQWVVQHAIEMIAQGRFSTGDSIGVNLSADSVTGHPRLLDLIESELSRTGIDPGRLIFEIPETAAITNVPETTSFTDRLAELGCSVALDDFGSGFGSFYYLKDLRVRYVKLDGEFIKRLPQNEVDQHVVQAIASVARPLHIKTVAEFVGDQETVGLLQNYGVDYAQGFYIGKPEAVAAPLSSPPGTAEVSVAPDREAFSSA